MSVSKSASVSVVIPVYNGKKYLGEALESVFSQTMPPTQIIVVDDGSIDGTQKVAQCFPKVEYIFQENSGAATARNKGVQQARGEYLSFLDADDLWTPRKLEMQLEALQDPCIHMVFGHAEQFLSPEIARDGSSGIKNSLQHLPAVVTGGMLIRRADFLRVGLLDTSRKIGDFIDWYLKAMEAGLQAKILSEVVLQRRIHTANDGIVNQHARSDYVHILKASLDRRREMQKKLLKKES